MLGPAPALGWVPQHPGASLLTACGPRDQPVQPASVLVELILDRRRLGPAAYVRCCLAHDPAAGCSAGRVAVDVPGLAQRHSDQPRPRPQPHTREQSAVVPDLRAWARPAWVVLLRAVPAWAGRAWAGPGWTVPAWAGPGWTGPARTGPARTGPAWTGPVCPPAARQYPWQQSHRCSSQHRRAALAQLMSKQQGPALRVELLNGLPAGQLLTQLRPVPPSSQVPDVRKGIAYVVSAAGDPTQVWQSGPTVRRKQGTWPHQA